MSEKEAKEKKSKKEKARRTAPSEKDIDAEVLRNVVIIAGKSKKEEQIWLQKLEKFLKLPEEERVERSRKLITFLMSVYKQRGKDEAGNTFLKALNTPETFIYFAYMWRPKFRELVIRAIASILAGVLRVGEA